MSLEDLKELEVNLDRELTELPLWKQPVRVVLFAMHFCVYNFFRTESAKAIAVAGRISHLIHLIAACPAEPTGESSMDAFVAYREVDPDLSQTMLAINYGHFSEVMPQAHRGFYRVTALGPKHLRLEHQSTEAADSETRDILLSELALSHATAQHPDVRSEIAKLALTLPRADVKLIASVMGSYIHHYLTSVNEPEFLSDSVMRNAFGVSNAEFARFKAFLLTIGNYAVDLSRAVEDRLRAAGGDAPELEAEWLEWISVCWTEDHVRHLARNLVGISDEVITKLFAVFGLNFRSTPPDTKNGGDGYFPPLALLPGNGILIGPYFTWFFSHARNALYALQRIDQRRFDNVVSGDLEPQLIRNAEALLQRLPGLKLRANVVWGAGEIDLLVFEPVTNTVVQIQAKAPIAPYGARMVDRLEGRIEEGIHQLRSFRALPQEEIDSIVSRAVGQTVSGVKVVDVLLARSCFGTHRTWSMASDICFLSLAVLSDLTRSGQTNRPTSIADLPKAAKHCLDGVIANSNPVWTHKPLVLGKWTLDVPMLDFNQNYVDAERRRVWSM